ncbi:37S ribosomal protein-like protein Mrp17 [Elsinoe ampelina]|uniref:Small ribosomal subunit protein bS6m n=1 Tax=Elsinoe ampelina TaxID=302913 RepID=A0A6A6GJF5_9PEZI|nr:37S ribosomal protein-like protein Mrp17 [Elsinoe ampelina]
MPLYELIGIVRPGKVAEVREIAKTTSTLILNAGGVIRGITNWGTFLLPKPQRRHNAVHHFGHHFIVRFDSSSRTQHAVRRTLGLDPRMIRYSVVKLGSTLEQIKDISGEARWDVNKENRML